MTATLQANCPACGAEINFKAGASVVVVCEYCHSAIARTDRALEDLGRVAEIVESGSPLDVGARGTYRGTAFELTGRAQLGHAAGGMWDEWYATFADGRTGWLAEAQGRFYLTYRAPASISAPSFEALQLGQPVQGIPVGVALMVAERGEARTLGARGEIPYKLTPNETYAYADLSGQGGVFATIDYSEQPPLVFVGREVALAELGLIETAHRREREVRQVSAAQLQCPQCAGPLELRAPDKTERVTCPNCGSLLDVNQGRLSFLKSLAPDGPQPFFPFGTVAEFEGHKLTIIGFMVRSVEFDKRYYWEEYLLYNPEIGFRWLVQSDRHWSYVRAVAPGEVSEQDKRATFGGETFKAYQDAVARVEHVAGEFYWKVSVGELVRAVDYVNAPKILTKEVSGIVGHRQGEVLEAEEINWSLGTYVPVKEMERIFGVKNLPPPSVVAPNQPFPHKKIYKYWLLLSLVALGFGLFGLVTSSRTKIFERAYTFQANPTPTPLPLANGQTPTQPPAPTTQTQSALNLNEATPQVVFSEPFELKARQNIRVEGRANVDNNWLYVEGDLINEATGLVQSFELPLEYYYGVEDGESWTEGDRDQSVRLSALPAGTYTLRLEAQWEKWNKAEPPQINVRVEQGEPGLFNFLLVLIALSVVPLLVLFKHFSFERQRWADSSFNPYESSDDSSDDE